jgi:transmembrane sensor
LEHLEHIRELFIKHMRGTASTAEQEALAGDIALYSNDELIGVLEPLAVSTPPDGRFKPEEWEEAIRDILRRAPESTPIRRLPVFRRQSVWWAAAVFILLASGAWLWFSRSSRAPGPIQTLSLAHDALPGGNRALLTLANGSRITLDSAANGTLTQQGNASVTKLANGRLAYTALPGAPAQTLYNILSTPRGGQYQLILPDGTKVWLDAASSIRYPTAFTASDRQVSITGQAYFEVAHDKRKPFSVLAAGTEIRDIGTAFNINAYADELAERVTLVEGSVAVSQHGRRLILQPGQQAQVSMDDLELAKNPDIDAALAWKNGKFQFGDAADISEIMRQLARWYDVDVEYKGMPSGHIGGTISRDINVSQVFKMLEMTGTVKFIIDGKKVTVMP